ncbi:MAG: ATP-binding cassette domain-containing protein, partial [Oscillospiraceae bacterium]|nr:ATP-binding cassette domain-containing protein [Oscillospiraceae bacterium]
MIRLEHVSKTFGGPAAVHAVRDVSLEIAPGEIFGIIGYSGAGKSTLVRCMNLLEIPTCGKVTVDGQVLVDIPQPGEKADSQQGRGAIRMPQAQLREMRKKIGMIFQQF